MLKHLFSFEKDTKSHITFRLLGIKFHILKPDIRKNRRVLRENFSETINEIPQATGDLRLIQEANLGLLKEFDKICKENNITYWLDFGSLLGAARHKGFIPWDDDIDVGMMRDDYEKFIELFQNGFENNPDLYIYFSNNHKNKCFIKVRHRLTENAFVDIFPYDYYHSSLSPEQKDKLSEKIEKLIKPKVFKWFESNESMRNYLKGLTHKHILNRISSEKSVKPAIFFGLDYPHKWKHKVYNYEDIFPIKEVLFEGCNFPAPNMKHNILTSVYGDYMSIPKNTYPRHTAYNSLSEGEKRILKKMSGIKRVITYGTFDVLHFGHINLLTRAKALGDYLIVGLSTDEFNAIKNKKSYYTYEQRKMILEALKYVDIVIPEDNWEQKRNDILKYKANIFVMGSDWEHKFDDLSDLCEVIYLPRTENVSSTQTKEYLKAKVS